MLRTKLVGIVSLAIMLLVAAAPSDRLADCDMKTIVKGFWCESCKLGMEKSDLASGATYYYCDGCEKASAAEGK